MPQDCLDDKSQDDDDDDYHIAQYVPKHHLGHELGDDCDSGDVDDAVGDNDGIMAKIMIRRFKSSCT